MSQSPWSLAPRPIDSPSARTPDSHNSDRSATLPTSSRRTAKTHGGSDSEHLPIIAFCHLGWDWVWQRPQQYLSRFAQRHRVLFVETYCADTKVTRIDLRTPPEHPNVTVLQMHLPSARWHDGAWIDEERRRALHETLRHELHRRFDQPLLWFYDPMAVVAFAGHLDERAIIYDCMDELSQFKDAPPDLIEREKTLLVVADVVFCGGQKMRKKRVALNPNCHFFGTGVDVEHFGHALSPDLAPAPEVCAFGGAPILGYFGVIDERIDYELLAKLADAYADWQIMMVGPTAKVDTARFPQRPNLHWIGSRPYETLPALTKGFSVTLMPFALNAATEYINPTKALEYMAAGRPVVSTALDEVKLNFGSVARIARSHAEFIALCCREVEKPSKTRIARGLKLAAANTWEANVDKMEKLIAEVLTPIAPLPQPSGLGSIRSTSNLRVSASPFSASSVYV